MNFTEEEASSKWCPFAVVGSSIGRPGINRIYIPAEKAEDGNPHIKIPDGCQCIGSACGVWRDGGHVKGKKLGDCGLARKGGQSK